MNQQITKDMDLEDVAREAPKAIGAMTRRGIICIQCGTPLWKTVEEAMRDAGIEDVDALVKEVNIEVADAL